MFFLVVLPIVREDVPLSFGRVVEGAFVVMLTGAAWGAAMWFTFTKPLLAQRGKRR
jgi:hypothetical protein